jgi:putative redox protein
MINQEKAMLETKIIATAEAENTGTLYTTQGRLHQQELLVDESTEFGGQDQGPMPGDYLCLSLASCKVITLRMYAQRKGWLVNQIKVTVSLAKGSQTETGQYTFFCELSLTGELDEAQRKRLLEISKACPIQRLLAKPSEVVTKLV